MELQSLPSQLSAYLTPSSSSLIQTEYEKHSIKQIKYNKLTDAFTIIAHFQVFHELVKWL